MEYQLRTGTKLAGRYRIEGVIGQGGFSITYLGMDEHVQMRVAIKELYVSEYMSRNIEISPEVFLPEGQDPAVFDKAREDFLKEAIIIGIFSGDSGVVDVRDHFRENNTAYIVMEYLDGISLSRYLKENGPMSGKEVFEKMLPLVSTLKKIHNNEVIHRDISPDNVMVLSDGSFKLIDFGAARNYSAKEELSRIVKDGYAPVEQWNKDGKQGPWTDIYALSATIYECITGITPESAVQRMFFDEMKKPSELNIRLEKELERIIWKGMAIAPEDRYQNLEDMEKEIRKIIPDSVPANTMSARMKAVVAIMAVVISGLGVAGGYTGYQDYKEKHKFAGIQTQTTVVAPGDEMTARDYYENRKLVEERIRILANDLPYQIDESENGELLITLPSEVFCRNDVDEIYDALILSKWESLVGGIRNQEGKLIFCSLGSEDIISITRCEGSIPLEQEQQEAFREELEEIEEYLEVRLTNEKAGEIRRKMPQLRKGFLMSWYDEIKDSGYGYDIFLDDEKDIFYICSPYLQDGYLENLFEFNLTHDGFEQPFQFSSSIVADWENVENNMLAGTYQCNVEEIADPAVTVVYEPVWDQTELLKGDWIYILVNLKQRLDSLQVHYAVGVENDNSQHIVIKMERDKASRYVLDTLLENYISMRITSLWKEAPVYLSNMDIHFEEGKDPAEGTVLVAQADEYIQDDIREFTETQLEQGATALYIQVGKYLLAECRMTEPIADGKLIFTNFADERVSAFQVEGKHLDDYFDMFINNAIMAPSFFTNYKMKKIVFTDDKGNPILSDSLEPDVYMLNSGGELEKEILTLYPECKLGGLEEWNDLDLTIDLSLDNDEEWLDHALTVTKDIFNSTGIKDGWLESIYFSFSEKGKDKTKMSLHFSCKTSEESNQYFVSAWIYDDDEEYLETVKEKMMQDEFFANMLSEDSFW